MFRKKSKKSMTSFEMLMWVMRIVFLVVIMFAVVALVRSYVSVHVDASEARANVFAYKLLYSPNGISYFDAGIKRVYPGIIDLDRLALQPTEKFLEKSNYYGLKNLEAGAKISVKNLKDNKDTIVFYNEEFYKEQEKFVLSGLTEGPGGTRLYTKTYEVLVRRNNELNKGFLVMDIAMPNS